LISKKILFKHIKLECFLLKLKGRFGQNLFTRNTHFLLLPKPNFWNQVNLFLWRRKVLLEFQNWFFFPSPRSKVETYSQKRENLNNLAFRLEVKGSIF